MKPVLLTGASGALGRQITRHMATLGWHATLTDVAPFPDDVPANMRFVQADLNDGVTVLKLAEGCGTILHFGGVSTERAFELILGANIRGLYHVYEAARREGARVVFASSNHAIGFHGVDTKLDDDCALMPDGYYGLSKAYGELMGRMYWMKHGVPSIFLRIGSCFPEPTGPRMLSTWLSYPDLCRLVERCVLAEDVETEVIWGASANSRTYWGRDSRAKIGWEPRDSADAYADRFANAAPATPPTSLYQGGGFTAMDYTRKVPPWR
jgi:uronate dehydrogenase